MLRTFVALVPASQCLRKGGEEHTYQNYSVLSRSSRTPIVPRRSSIVPGFAPSFHCLLLTPVVSIGSPDSILDLVGLFLENIDLVVVPSCRSIDSNHLGLRTFPCICCARVGILVVGILVVAHSFPPNRVFVLDLFDSSYDSECPSRRAAPLLSSNCPGWSVRYSTQRSVVPVGSVERMCLSGHLASRFVLAIPGWSGTVSLCTFVYWQSLPAVLSTLEFLAPASGCVHSFVVPLLPVFSDLLVDMQCLTLGRRSSVRHTRCPLGSQLPSEPCSVWFPLGPLPGPIGCYVDLTVHPASYCSLVPSGLPPVVVLGPLPHFPRDRPGTSSCCVAHASLVVVYHLVAY